MKVVKVRFRNAGKAYDFDSSHLGLEVGDKVIVKTEKGLSLGTVVSGPIEEEDRGKTAGIKKVIRKATSVDFSQEIMNSELEKVAYDYCLQQIKKLGLPMKLVQVECLFDRNQCSHCKSHHHYTIGHRHNVHSLNIDVRYNFHHYKYQIHCTRVRRRRGWCCWCIRIG